jgi:hypothetical protein
LPETPSKATSTRSGGTDLSITLQITLPPPSPPDMPDRTPVRAGNLAISLCEGMIQLLGLAGLADSRLNSVQKRWPQSHSPYTKPRFCKQKIISDPGIFHKKTAYRIQKLILKTFSYVSSNLRAYVRYFRYNWGYLRKR